MGIYADEFGRRYAKLSKRKRTPLDSCEFLGNWIGWWSHCDSPPTFLGFVFNVSLLPEAQVAAAANAQAEGWNSGCKVSASSSSSLKMDASTCNGFAGSGSRRCRRYRYYDTVTAAAKVRATPEGSRAKRPLPYGCGGSDLCSTEFLEASWLI